jgi:hypothetical protein
MTLVGLSRLTTAAVVCIAGCSAPARELSVPDHVTHVEITGRSMDVLRRIDEPTKIAAILDFVRDHRSGWNTPLAGVPVGRLSAVFYNGKTCLGHFSVGPRFFETDLAGDFRSINASDSETATFLSLVDMAGTPLNDPKT